MRRIAVGVGVTIAVAALFLGGCTVIPDRTPVTFTVACDTVDASGVTHHEKFTDFRTAWAGGGPWVTCTASRSGGTVHTQLQVAATELAGYRGFGKLGDLYALCAETGGYYVVNDSVTAEQAAEIDGMLAICPDFPYAADLGSAALDAHHAAEQARGRRFGDGTWLIGSQVEAGSYLASSPGETCSWQRLDADSHVIDENTVDAAQFAQVTLLPSDYEILSQGCGDFVRIG